MPTSHPYRRLYMILITLVGLWWLNGRSVHAQTMSPWETADAMRTALFEAQKGLLADDVQAAQAGVETAVSLFETHLAEPFRQTDALLVVREGLAMAQTAVATQNPTQLAVARGQVWTALLWGSYDLAIAAVEQDQPETAQTWLHLREFRTATRFTRPGADATLALRAWQEGNQTAEQTTTALTADLLDTYQARLNEVLDETADAIQRDLPLRQAEAAGLAQGYWHLLAPAYESQQGTAAREQADGLFQGLVTAVLQQDIAILQTQLAQAETLLTTFRAAPLSAAEQARRAGQLLRFLALVPVEYERGVRNGQVTVDLEIQEAVTFHQGARAAFNDLRLNLNEMNRAKTAEIAVLLDQIEINLQAASRREFVVQPSVIEDDIAATQQALTKLLPPAWLETNPDADFDVLVSVLDQMETAVQQGQYDLAESARLEAYATFDFGLEPRLLAFAPEMVAQIDGLFWQGYNGQTGLAQAIALQGTPAEIRQIRQALDAALGGAQLMLGDLPTAPAAIIGNAAVIVFREGLEAVLILAALMASMVGGYAVYRKPMVWGVVLAFLGTAVTWFIAQQILQTFSRLGERLEALVSLIAIGVLLLITNWFFHKTYWTDWMATFHRRKRQLLGRAAGQFVGLLLLGFTSVYREGFETVLFLQALVLEAGIVIVLQGVVVGLLAVFLVGFAVFRLQVRLPYKKMLIYTGILIGVVLVTMVGNTVHVMQAVGWLPITPVRDLTFPYWLGLWFGVFATWQGLVAQVSAVVFVIGSYFLAEHLQKQRRVTPGQTVHSSVNG